MNFINAILKSNTQPAIEQIVNTTPDATETTTLAFTSLAMSVVVLSARQSANSTELIWT